MTSLSRSWHRWAATASVACVARLVAVADWWRGWPKVINCSCQWFTFWTYLITVNLFSLYLINFMFHTTLDTVGNILTVNYKSMKYDVNSLSQGSVSTLFRWGEDIIRDFRVCVKSVLPAYSSAKIIRNQTSFSRVMTTNVLSRFCESQCIYIFGGSCPLTEYCHVQNSLCVHLCTIAQVSRAISSQLRHLSTIGKNLLSSNTFSTRPVNMVNFGPLTAEIDSGVWGTPTNFNGFCVLAALLHGI